ncbi:ras-like protein [Achlya hypogyna]|uniref:Ras-like protein n=1 Tax=Achlya hypogyna TaxID=1202772 RepID=A0A1V9Z4W6_ACHHY|nr:ras-like protein [Achlya hypogyna]
MAEKRLFVYKNEAGAEGKVVSVKRGDSFATFKSAAAKKLGVKAKRIFLASGAEIQSMDELQNNDTLYVSGGEAFYKSQPLASGQETVQLSVLGSGGVGKSALTLRFVRDYFVRDWDPTIEDAYRKTLEVQGTISMLEILDTAGQDDFESLRAQWMMDKDAYVFVYSMDSRTSLHELQPFFELHMQINENKRPMPPIILVANKKDVVEQDPTKCQVPAEEGRRIAQAYNAKYIETSALTGENVPAVFEALVSLVRRNRTARPPRKKTHLCTIL